MYIVTLYTLSIWYIYYLSIKNKFLNPFLNNINFPFIYKDLYFFLYFISTMLLDILSKTMTCDNIKYRKKITEKGKKLL